MAKIDIKKIEARRQSRKTSEEYINFTTMIDDVRDFFLPEGGRLRTQVSAGAKLNKRRVSDLGISMLNDYAAGVISELVTSGQEWFGVEDSKAVLSDADFFTQITKQMFNAVNGSNFYSEIYRDQKGAGCDGTSCFYVERIDGQLNNVHVPFGSFQFSQDFRGVPDIVWVEKKTTASALVGEYGENKVSQKCKDTYEKDPEKEMEIVYYCAPRKIRDASKKDILNKAYELIVYEKEENHLLDEGGTDIQKFLVYRVKRIMNETLGRGPCIETACSMAAVERSSKEYERCARLAGVPIFGIGASMGQNGFRWVNQENASLLIYNDTGIGGPPVTMNPDTNPEFILKYIELVTAQMRQLFYLDYFNPVMNKKNITATQTREIVNKSQQMVDQLVGPLIQERLNPYLQWVFILLGEAGKFNDFGSWSDIQAKMAGGRIKFQYKSRLANAQKRIKLSADLEYAEIMGMIAQSIPDPVMQYEFLVRTDFNKLPEKIREGVNASLDLLRPEKQAKQMAEAFAQSMAKQAEMDNMVKGADAASKGNAPIEPNSLTGMVLNR